MAKERTPITLFSRTKTSALTMLFALAILTLGCARNGSDASLSLTQQQRFSASEVAPSLWIDSPENRRTDPFQDLIQGIRDRKINDLANADAPRPFAGEDLIAKEFLAPNAPWQPLRKVLTFDWQTLERSVPQRVAALQEAVRFRTVLEHPDLHIVEVALAPSAHLPSHALADPSAFHVVGGAGVFQVGGSTAGGKLDQRATPGLTLEATLGTTIHLEPYQPRSITAASKEPLKLLWFRWAPGGNAAYLSFGYYLTGANFHLQPLEATFPPDYEHWQEDALARSRTDSLATPPYQPLPATAGRLSDEAQWQQAKSSMSTLLYPEVAPAFDQAEAAWIDFTKLEDSGFFWAKDAEAGAGLLERWNQIARMKGIYRAAPKNGPYDFNMSYIALGPTAKYVTHSHATPEFYYLLEGETEWIIEGTTLTAKPGHVYFHAPFQDHEMRGLKEGVPMRAITGSWAPFGDRSVWSKPAFLLEALSPQPAGAIFPKNFSFHTFPTKPLTFATQ